MLKPVYILRNESETTAYTASTKTEDGFLPKIAMHALVIS